MPKYIILGSSNAVPKVDQENTHLYVEAERKKILIDCGDNAMVSLAKIGVDPNTITDLVLTHFHPDHVGSLPLFLIGMWLEKRTLPLTIHGLEYTLDRAKAMLGLFGWTNWTRMYPVDFKVAAENGRSLLVNDDDIEISSLPVKHLVPTIGLRVEFSGGPVIVYSCDTEPCENLSTLAVGADILLQEAAGPGKGHTSAEQAGQIAEKAKVRYLILIHYEKRVGEKNLLQNAKKGFSGQVDLAVDEMQIL